MKPSPAAIEALKRMNEAHLGCNCSDLAQDGRLCEFHKAYFAVDEGLAALEAENARLARELKTMQNTAMINLGGAKGFKADADALAARVAALEAACATLEQILGEPCSGVADYQRPDYPGMRPVHSVACRAAQIVAAVASPSESQKTEHWSASLLRCAACGENIEPGPRSHICATAAPPERQEGDK